MGIWIKSVIERGLLYRSLAVFSGGGIVYFSTFTLIRRLIKYRLDLTRSIMYCTGYTGSISRLVARKQRDGITPYSQTSAFQGTFENVRYTESPLYRKQIYGSPLVLNSIFMSSAGSINQEHQCK